MNKWQQKYYSKTSDINSVGFDVVKGVEIKPTPQSDSVVNSDNFVFNGYRFFKQKDDAWYLRRVGSKKVYYLGKAIDFSKTYQYNE